MHIHVPLWVAEVCPRTKFKLAQTSSLFLLPFPVFLSHRPACQNNCSKIRRSTYKGSWYHHLQFSWSLPLWVRSGSQFWRSASCTVPYPVI